MKLSERDLKDFELILCAGRTISKRSINDLISDLREAKGIIATKDEELKEAKAVIEKIRAELPVYDMCDECGVATTDTDIDGAIEAIQQIIDEYEKAAGDRPESPGASAGQEPGIVPKP
jgi:hypothetical protein